MKEKNSDTKKNSFITFLKAKLCGKERVRNKALFKKGGYSLIITALVLSALILFNWLINVLSGKITLEFDMSADKINSISVENAEYIKNVKDEISVTVCGKRSTYKSELSEYVANTYNISGGEDYYDQTLYLIEKYHDYNNKIDVKFVGLQSTEFTALSQQYSSFNLTYGDIIVTCTKNGNTRVKHLTFNDVYIVYDPTGYASYGYGYYTIAQNKIETALTSAISYVTNDEVKKAAVFTGHSKSDYSSSLRKLLSDNNYEVTAVSDVIISNISDEYDIIVIMSPTSDFLTSELDAVAAYLENGGEGGKGLMFFADASTPACPNLYGFLSEWGIEVGEGILFETNPNFMVASSVRSALLTVPNAAADDIAENMRGFITAYNVPMNVSESAESSITATEIIQTLDSVVTAPVGASDDWSDYPEGGGSVYAGVIQSKRTDLSDESYIMAFSSTEYIESEWAENSSLQNKELVLAVANRAVGADYSEISFVEKSITEESYADSVSASDVERVRNIFMIIIPVVMVIIGIVVFIRRRNAE